MTPEQQHAFRESSSQPVLTLSFPADARRYFKQSEIVLYRQAPEIAATPQVAQQQQIQQQQLQQQPPREMPPGSATAGPRQQQQHQVTAALA